MRAPGFRWKFSWEVATGMPRRIIVRFHKTSIRSERRTVRFFRATQKLFWHFMMFRYAVPHIGHPKIAARFIWNAAAVTK